MGRKETVPLVKALGIIVLCGICAAGVAAAQDKGSVYSLEDLLRLGLERNPRVTAAAFETEAREAAYRAARLFANPELEFHLGRAESHDRFISRDTFGFAVSQLVENPIKRRHRVAMSRLEWEGSRQAHALQVLEASYNIKSCFYNILFLEKREALLKKIADSVRQMHRLIEVRAELGETKPLDVVKLLVEALQAEKEQAALRAELEQAREELNILLGGALPPDFTVTGELNFLPVPRDDESLVDRALAEHPLVQEQRRLLERARSNVSFIRAQRLPDLTLKGFNDSGLDGVNRGVQFGLSVPLWNFRSRELAEARSLSLKGERELAAVRLELAGGIRDSLRRVRLAGETLAVFNDALLHEVEQSLEIAEVSYREGEISLLEFLDTQRTYNNVLGDYLRALLAWNTEMAALEKAAGVPIR
ncbi:MAG: hypothetical protein A2Y86_01860 [Candidatus Aminicenantes bacterium RBG_13_62_12]|nr:MAG: hypothetical protein A2Y86_01860 [Candidatus Aminicenantes bacterium RBG_13_62_12]